MAVYEIHLRDKNAQVSETEEFQSNNDEEAATQARALYAEASKGGFVLMRDTRIILDYYPPA